MKQTENATINSRVIKASKEDLFDAFTQPEALLEWQAPGEMQTKMHSFDLRVGGGYDMSLYYPSGLKGVKGKTKDNEDRFNVRFDELVRGEKIVETIKFDTSDPEFSGEMKMAVRFEPKENGVQVTIEFSDIPHGIKPEDNEAGTESSLDKLEAYISK